MAVVNKKIFDTDNALKGSFNGLWGRWQLLTYSFFVIGYAIIVGWIARIPDYTLLTPSNVRCNYSSFLENRTYNESNVVQRLSGKPKYINIMDENNKSVDFVLEYSNEYGNTVLTDLGIVCDLSEYSRAPKFSNYFGYIIGALTLGLGSDIGGRKIIILACIWTTGVMSIFQVVGHDFISYVFFQFFIGLFIGGVQASFLPAIIEMFPINFRAFYGVCFHLVVCLFELLLPMLAHSFNSWTLLQLFVTVPVVLTAVLQWFVYESIFWFLAHKEYDKAIKVLTKLAKRNGISFETKFKQAKEFLHAKHSKATQVDILPLLRLQDLDALGKKYPLVDMAELQKQKANSSKFRRFLNSLKGESYRSTNTIYRPYDFIYSPTLLVYVLILAGLWFTNGLTDSIESVMGKSSHPLYLQMIFSNLPCLLSSSIAIVLAIFKIGRRWMIFLAYLVIEVCLLGSIITNYTENDSQTEVALIILYYLCKFATHFGFIFLMLITAELFPTSLRCTGMGICFILKMTGSCLSSSLLMNYNSTMHRLGYCLLTLFFGAMTLFLPETKTFPLPRSILQIEAMPTAIGKKLRSKKVKLACERRQTIMSDSDKRRGLLSNPQDYSNLGSNPKILIVPSTSTDTYALKDFNASSTQTNERDQAQIDENLKNKNYDTVTSVHDIEQDDHIYYGEKKDQSEQPLLNFERKLGKIVEVPSKNITRNNSVSDIADHANTKV